MLPWRGAEKERKGAFIEQEPVILLTFSEKAKTKKADGGLEYPETDKEAKHRELNKKLKDSKEHDLPPFTTYMIKLMTPKLPPQFYTP